ncbi:TPA: hypothetical protein RUS85_004796 [Citrobacter amalonaticus]|nr:hypothetical protein [Citrobacter amalonaticus]
MEKKTHGAYSFLINLMVFISIAFMLYTLLAFYSNAKRNSQLLAVQWCDVRGESELWADQYRGIYLYAEDNGRSHVNIKAQMFEGRNYSIWNPYRLFFEDNIAEEVNMDDARKKWSHLTCLPGGKATAGENRFIIE